MTGDGNGGAIAVYEDKLGGNIFAQKIKAQKSVIIDTIGMSRLTWAES